MHVRSNCSIGIVYYRMVVRVLNVVLSKLEMSCYEMPLSLSFFCLGHVWSVSNSCSEGKDSFLNDFGFVCNKILHSIYGTLLCILIILLTFGHFN